ncbi:protein transport protein SEC61 subunit alpha [Strigomonas culicis]|uniref:Protein transport protein SEC61 subunit alpha n=1 Tax=Strigomonas culicis TaxID=28005 RepID=S9UXX2_9TRYP|nr:protein transport protein SEC61 subunit alpha [Strigomonas culicis]|eukprot:EPY35707.1 protein transport protein SEC61 subunit alpha [Strigomonas culicis]
MDRVREQVVEGGGRGEVIGEPADGELLAVAARVVAALLPAPEQVDEEVAVAEAAREHLGDKVDVRHDARLQNDGHVARVEELDEVGLAVHAIELALRDERHAEALEEDDDDEHDKGGKDVGEVRQLRAVESLAQCTHLVGARHEQVEEGDDRPLELRAAAGVDRRRREALPHNRLAHVRRDEERRAAADAPAALQQLVQQHAHDGGEQQLEHNHSAHEEPDAARLAVHAGRHVRGGLADRDEDCQQLLQCLKERPLLLVLRVVRNDADARDELQDERRGHHRRNAQLHECAAITRQHDTHPVEGVRAVRRPRAVHRDLAANEKDEEGDRRPHDALLDGRQTRRLVYLRQQLQDRLQNVKQTTGHGADERGGREWGWWK